MLVLRLRSELRARAATRAACALAGVLAAVIALAIGGLHVGGSSARTLLIPLVALLGGLAIQRLEADALQERLAAITDLPAGATPADGELDRRLLVTQAVLVALVTVAAGLIIGAGADAAVLVLAIVLAFVFADLLAARDVERLEHAQAMIVYTPPSRSRDFDGPLYAQRVRRDPATQP